MEEVLDVYERAFDENNPVICLDESPKQLISEVREGFKDSKGVVYEDFEYRREGVVDLYLACEPLAGKREIFVRENHNRLSFGGNNSIYCRTDVSCGAENNDCAG